MNLRSLMLPGLQRGKSTARVALQASADAPVSLAGRDVPIIQERQILFLGDLSRQSEREVCVGAANYAAQRPSWVLDPCPITSTLTPPPPRPGMQCGGVLANERALQQIRRLCCELKPPVVYYLADQAHAGTNTVCIDERAVGEMAAEHLWSRGYRCFAFIGSSDWGWSNARGDGFSQWLARHGKKPEMHLFSNDLLPVSWSENLRRHHLCLQGLMQSLPAPCGIFTANDVIACLVIQAARHHRYRVPQDLGVIGVDNDPFPNATAGMPISSIELPFREVGFQAARLLDQCWEGSSIGKSIRLPPVRVVVRVSSDAFMTVDTMVRKAQSFIETRRHGYLTVRDVTRAVGTNRTTLGNRFQRDLGVTLHEYVLRRRLAYAQERLLQGDASVERVAAECGFPSASYFSDVFTRVIGQRPGWVRRNRVGSVTDAL